MKVLSLGLAAMALAMLCACSKPPQTTVQQSPESPETRLQQIPPADPQKYDELRGSKTWRNPYLLVKPDGLWLLDLSNNEERPLNPNQVLDVLAALPGSAWPYGRVVAVQEIGGGNSDADRVALRKNRAILAGSLEGAKVLINWIPGA